MPSALQSVSSHSNIESTVENFLHALHYDFRQFELNHFVEWIRDTHDTEILLVPIPMPSELFGGWVHATYPPCEYVIYDADLPAFHQAHTILHELCHYLCKHGTKIVEHTDVLMLIEQAKQGDMEYVRQFFGVEARQRSGDRHSREEQQAETLALLIQEKVDDQSRLYALTTQETSNDDLREFLFKIGIINEV